jgi:glycerophosphoryl diester phosphodiesterase
VPVEPRWKYLDAATPLAFAHRGGAAEGDENTAEAFGRAIALGYRYVETDVHATADGVPVVFHDPTLLRMTGNAAPIATLSWADLATVRVGGAAAVPRLDAVLDAWPQVRFNIDVKADAAAGPAVEAVQRAGAEDRVLLASFFDARLARIRALAGPRVATSLGRRSVARLWLASRLPDLHGPARKGGPGREGGPELGGRGRMAGIAAAQVPPGRGRLTIVDRRFLDRAHRLGLQVHVWTIDEPGEMHRLLDLGVDGIMTDRVEVLRKVYADRGHWPPA